MQAQLGLSLLTQLQRGALCSQERARLCWSFARSPQLVPCCSLAKLWEVTSKVDHQD